MQRRSIFRETGLDGGDESCLKTPRSRDSGRPHLNVRFRSNDSIIGQERTLHMKSARKTDDTAQSVSQPSQPSQRAPRLPRFTLVALVLVILLPLCHNAVLLKRQNRPASDEAGSALRVSKGLVAREASTLLVERDDTQTDICKRWSHQTAVVNGTMYIYGGRATTDDNQVNNTWNNNFLTLDLKSNWQTSAPALKGLPKPSGPPAVSLAYLWNSHGSLFLYGGEFSDSPPATPSPFSLWEYDIGATSWKEHSNPKTLHGKNSEPDGQPVQRSAEGAGFSVAALGRGWYFGGHLDQFTTPGWSNQVERLYLKSLVEYTFPGASNNDVDSLTGGKLAGQDGAWRNITSGGVQDTNSFPERADGVLVYVPGFGAEGILLGLTGGTDAKFTQMNVIDVYDIATSTWYKQSTSGPIPKIRVNPCAVVAAAPDGSSYNIYMYGGQNLVPFKEQVQYDDMWILSIPAFTWIQVDLSSQSNPPARAGHTCNIWDGQMVVVGGYVGQELSCDSPGIYVFNLTSLSWVNQYTTLANVQIPGATNDNEDSHMAKANPFSQQYNQRGSNSTSGLEGSLGYAVPPLVASKIGGSANGGATVTAPLASPTGGGPLATGRPITYPGAPSDSSSGGTNVGAIVAGVVAGVFAVIAAYFAFCAWLYRKQVRLYKSHMAAFHRSPNGAASDGAASNSPAQHEKRGLLPPIFTAWRKGDTSHSSSFNSSKPSASTPVSDPYSDTAYNAGANSGNPPNPLDARAGGHHHGSASVQSSTDDLLSGMEPSFWGRSGVLLNPRRSLRVVNRD